MLPGAFVVAGCTTETALTQEQKDKVDELTAGKTDEEKKEMLKNLTEDQKKDLGLNADQLNQLNQIQSQQISGTDPLGGAGGGGAPIIPPGGPGPLPPGGPGPIPPGGPGPGPLPVVP